MWTIAPHDQSELQHFFRSPFSVLVGQIVLRVMTHTAGAAELTLSSHTPKGLLLKGPTYAHKDTLRTMGGKYCRPLQGWVFSKKTRGAALTAWVSKVKSHGHDARHHTSVPPAPSAGAGRKRSRATGPGREREDMGKKKGGKAPPQRAR